jgi:hypothetical protein
LDVFQVPSLSLPHHSQLPPPACTATVVIAKSGGYGLDLAIQAEHFSTGLLHACRFSDSLQDSLRLVDITPGMRYQDNLRLASRATLHF